MAVKKIGVAVLPNPEGSRDLRADWERQVRRIHGQRCSNCGSEHHLKVQMVVPPEAGGQLVTSNGILLCRACRMAHSTVPSSKTGADRPVSLWVSRQLHNRLRWAVETAKGCGSMSALVRYLVSEYVGQPSAYEDIWAHQDEGAEVKVNLWLSTEDYVRFKTEVDNRGNTVTDGLKALILMYYTDMRERNQ